MKFIHLSDLHLGKRLNEVDLIEDQKYITDRIFEIIDSENPDAVIIAGDIYDRAIPSLEAVNLFDEILYKLSERKKETFIISGNHDSADRISFAGRLIDLSGIHLSPVYSGEVRKFTVKDSYGETGIYMLPFIKPALARQIFPDEEISTYTDAVKAAVKHMDIDTSSRNILVAHQFVTGSERCDSEEISVGGSDNVDISAFDGFDYVALGHLHGPQSVGRETVRYCGTPLKYSFSEVSHKKSVTVVEMKEKGNTEIRTVDLVPLRDIAELKGEYNELLSAEFSARQKKDNYFRVTLTDRDYIMNAMNVLRTVYPNIMKLDYVNLSYEYTPEFSSEKAGGNSMIENFREFYEKINGEELDSEQEAYLVSLIEKIEEGEK